MDPLRQIAKQPTEFDDEYGQDENSTRAGFMKTCSIGAESDTDMESKRD